MGRFGYNPVEDLLPCLFWQLQQLAQEPTGWKSARETLTAAGCCLPWAAPCRFKSKYVPQHLSSVVKTCSLLGCWRGLGLPQMSATNSGLNNRRYYITPRRTRNIRGCLLWPLPWMLLCLLPCVGHFRALGGPLHLTKILVILGILDLGYPYPCLPYRWWPAHSAHSPEVAEQGSRLWWPRQHRGWGAGCRDTQQWRHTQQLSLLKISWTPLLALQVWVHEFGNPTLFPHLIPVYPSGLLLTAGQAMLKSGFCKQVAFLKVPKTSLIILS